MEDRDDDLERAIAMSLGQQPHPSANAVDPILIEDSDDEDMKRAIALSLGHHEPAVSNPSSALIATERDEPMPSTVMEAEAARAAPVTSSASGLAALDRKAMERERLARVAARASITSSTSDQHNVKRQRSISPPALSRPSKVTRSGARDISTERTVTAPSPSDPKHATVYNSTSRPTHGTDGPRVNGESKMRPPVADGEVHFPEGRLFKTWAFHQPRTGSEIKIEEVLERRTLKTALLSAFQVEFEWIFTKIDTQKTRFQFVLSEKDASRRNTLKADLESLGANVKACFPPLLGNANCMHSKLMLLFHPDKLRVAIPSANLVPYDWGESGGFMENTVWLIDLPRRDNQHTSGTTETPFLSELKYFLTQQGLESNILSGLDNFDWSATSRYAFIHSVANFSWGKDMLRTGLMGLSTAVNQLGLASPTTEVDMAASSIGALTPQQLALLSAAARGSLSVPSLPDGNITSLPTVPALDTPSFRLYYPTLDYIKSSPHGTSSGGTIWLRREHWTRSHFPRSVFRVFRSVRPGLLSHAKLILARSRGKAWVYSGSANASASAWGTLMVEKSGVNKGKARINCRNWEAGVLIPLDMDGEDEGKVPDRGVFERKGVPIVFELGTGKLEDEEGDPWFCDEWGHGSSR